MIAINKELLENAFLLNEAKKLKKSGFISNEQLSSITVELPVIKTQNNILIRIGFFVLGCLLYSSLTGVIALFTSILMADNIKISLFIYSIIGVVISEYLSKENYYKFGLDDAFIIGFQAFLCAAIGVSLDSLLAVFISMSIIGFVACIRYINPVSAIISLVGITATVCYFVIELQVVDKVYLPFVLLVLAAGFYLLYRRLSDKKNFYFYFDSIHVLQIFSLILGYLSMNYMVVRELSEELMGIRVTNEKDIPFAFLFYFFTFLIPVSYIVYSLIKKERTLFIIGILAFGFSIYTIRFYYAILSIEMVLTIGGIILFGITYLIIQKLKNNDSGITFKPERGSSTDILSNIEALIITTQTKPKPSVSEHKMPFGGGGFSGGGAGENY